MWYRFSQEISTSSQLNRSLESNVKVADISHWDTNRSVHLFANVPKIFFPGLALRMRTFINTGEPWQGNTHSQIRKRIRPEVLTTGYTKVRRNYEHVCLPFFYFQTAGYFSYPSLNISGRRWDLRFYCKASLSHIADSQFTDSVKCLLAIGDVAKLKNLLWHPTQ